MDESNGKKPRLRSVTAMLSETLRQLDEVINDTSDELKVGKRVDAITTKAGLLQSLFLAQSDEKKARLRHMDVDALTKENASLRAENDKLREVSKAKAPVTNMDAGAFQDSEDNFEARLAKRLDAEGGRTK